MREPRPFHLGGGVFVCGTLGPMALRAKAQPPERLRISIVNDDDDPEPLDFTTVISATIVTTRPNDSVEWGTTIVSVTTGTLLLEHVWALGDLSLPGCYVFDVHMVVPSGIRRTVLIYDNVCP